MLLVSNVSMDVSNATRTWRGHLPHQSWQSMGYKLEPIPKLYNHHNMLPMQNPTLVAHTWPNGDRSSSRSNKWGRYNWKCQGNHHSLCRPWLRTVGSLGCWNMCRSKTSGYHRELQSNNGWQNMVVHKSAKHVKTYPHIHFPPYRIMSPLPIIPWFILELKNLQSHL